MSRTDLTMRRELRGRQLAAAPFDLQECFFDTRVNLYAIQAVQEEFFQHVESFFCPYRAGQASLHLRNIIREQLSQQYPAVHHLMNGSSGQGKSNAGLESHTKKQMSRAGRSVKRREPRTN
jgi:hypothetical protein